MSWGDIKDKAKNIVRTSRRSYRPRKLGNAVSRRREMSNRRTLRLRSLRGAAGDEAISSPGLLRFARNLTRYCGFAEALLEFSFERFIEDSREQSVEFGGGLGLQMFQGVHFVLSLSNFILPRNRWNPQIVTKNL